jgi:hypothetical protein
MANIVWTNIGSRSVEGVGTTTDVFGGAAGDGMSLNRVGSVSVEAEADSGQTITGVVALGATVQNPYTLRWNRAPDYDLDNLSGVTGVRGQFVGAFPVGGPSGRLGYYVKSGSVSSGSLTIRLTATSLAGELI